MKIDFKAGANVEILKNEDGSGTVLIDERKNMRLAHLKPGEKFFAGDKKFMVLKHVEVKCDSLGIIKGGKTKVVEIGDLESRRFDDETNNWKNSGLRYYLNTTVFNQYEQLFGKGKIFMHNTDLTSIDGLKDYGISEDYVSIMTFDDYRSNQHMFLGREIKQEWMATPWSTKKRNIELSVCSVSSSGWISDCMIDDICVVRPRCLLDSNIFVSVEGEK